MIAYILNLADLALTLYALSLGAMELNPLAAAIIGAHPALFAAVKICALPLFLRMRQSRWYWPIAAVYGETLINNLIVIFNLWR